MSKGQEAKDLVIKKIQDAFGEDYVGVFDKKVYVWSKEDGLKTQVCISLTCPKTPIGTDEVIVNFSTGLDFENMQTVTPVAAQTEMSDKEKETIAELMARLGL